MRLLKLKFQNLNSLAGLWEIDFTHEAYLQNGLFVITGPTGAGKTTILDALTLALYGQTVRLDKITQSRNEIMSKHTRECMAEVHFEIHGTSYFSRWEQRASPKGKLQPLKKQFGTCDGRFIWTKNVEAEVKRVIGLEFSQFRQSIMLAQNGFAAFLNADVQQRKEILEKITSTEHFKSLARSILEKKGLEERKFQELQQKMEAISLLDEAKVAEMKGDYAWYRTWLEKEMPVWEGRLREILSWMAETEKAQKQYDELLLEKEVLEKAWETFQPERIRLEKALRAQKVREIYLRQKDLQKTTENLAQAIQNSEKNLQTGNADLQKSLENWELAKQSLEKERQEASQWEEVFQEVEKLDGQIQNAQRQWEETRTKLLKTSELHQKMEEKCRNLQQKRIQQEEKKASLQKYLEEHASDAPLVQEFSGIEILIQQLESFRTRELETLEKAYRQKTLKIWELGELQEVCQEAEKTYEETKAAYETHQKELLPSQWFSLQEEIKRIETFRECLKNLAQTEKEWREGNVALAAWEKERHEKKVAREMLEKEFRQLQETRLQAEKQRSWEAHRQALTPGMPCPLCGSLEHPWEENVGEDFSEDALEILRKEEKELEEKRIFLEVEEKDLARRIENLPVESWEREREKLTERRGEFLRNWGWSETWPPEEVERHLLQKESECAAARDRWNTWQETSASLEQARQDAEKAFREKKEILVLLTPWEEKKKQFHQDEDALKQKIAPFCATEMGENAVDWLALGEMLRIRCEKWQESEKNFRQVETELHEKQQELVEMTQTCRLLAEQVTELRKQESEEKEMLAKQRQKRRERFGEKVLAEERQKLQERLHKAVQKVADGEKEIALIQQRITTETELQKENEKRLKKMQVEKAMVQTQWTQELENEGFANEDEFREAFLEATVLETLQKEQTELTKRQNQWQGKWTQNEQNRAHLRQTCPTRRSREAISRKEKMYREVRTQWTEKKAVLARQLAENEARKEEAEAQQKVFLAQKKEWERWQLLYECVGAADGKGNDSFTSFAQNLVFGILLDHANEQLAYLSPRYRLCLEADKMLEIYLADTFHQGITRPAANLSGGETFLVSLALALGLTRMVSREIQIHSFFLDEGFGTLDEHSLHRALEALKRYQTQGKSEKLIGIISHVETLKEQIETKIEVTPVSPGISVLKGPGVQRL
ncbi:MAG: SbcC/MukB-like Walker B domain-containing protein [Planctomycetia bacterium]|nr:SbcC/MukB-like Walker B domain-containing protein [Planctomycetia bacterium]